MFIHTNRPNGSIISLANHSRTTYIITRASPFVVFILSEVGHSLQHLLRLHVGLATPPQPRLPRHRVLEWGWTSERQQRHTWFGGHVTMQTQPFGARVWKQRTQITTKRKTQLHTYKRNNNTTADLKTQQQQPNCKLTSATTATQLHTYKRNNSNTIAHLQTQQQQHNCTLTNATTATQFHTYKRNNSNTISHLHGEVCSPAGFDTPMRRSWLASEKSTL